MAQTIESLYYDTGTGDDHHQVDVETVMEEIKNDKAVVGIFNKIRKQAGRIHIKKKKKGGGIKNRETLADNAKQVTESSLEQKVASQLKGSDPANKGFDTTLKDRIAVREKKAVELIFARSLSKQDNCRESKNEEIELSLLTNDNGNDEEPQGTTNNKSSSGHRATRKGSKALLGRLMKNTSIGRKAGMAEKKSKNHDKALAWLGSPVDRDEGALQKSGKKTERKAPKAQEAPFFFDCACMPVETTIVVDDDDSVAASLPATTVKEALASTLLTDEDRLALEKKNWHREYLRKTVQKYLPDKDEKKEGSNEYDGDGDGDEQNSIHDTEEAILNPYDTSGEKLYVVLDDEEVRPSVLDETDDANSAVHESFENVLGDGSVHVYAYNEDGETITGSFNCPVQRNEVQDEKMASNNKTANPGHNTNIDDVQSTIEDSFEQEYVVGAKSVASADANHSVHEGLMMDEMPPVAKAEPDQDQQSEVYSDVKSDVNVDPFLFNSNLEGGSNEDNGDKDYNEVEDKSTGSIFEDLEEEEECDKFPVPKGFDLVEQLPPPPPPPYPSYLSRSGPLGSNGNDAVNASVPESAYDSTVVMQNGNGNDRIFVIDPNSFCIQNEDSNDCSDPEGMGISGVTEESWQQQLENNTSQNVYDVDAGIEGNSSFFMYDSDAELEGDTSFFFYDTEPDYEHQFGPEPEPEPEPESDRKFEPEANPKSVDNGSGHIGDIFTDAEDDAPFDESSTIIDDETHDMHPDDSRAGDSREIRYVTIKEIMDKAERKIEELDDDEEVAKSTYDDEGAKSTSYEDDSRTYASSSYGLPRKNYLPQGFISGCIGVDIAQEIVRGIDKYIDGYEGRQPQSDDEKGDSELLIDDDDDEFSSF